MSYYRTQFQILHIHPVGKDNASEFVYMAESPAAGHEDMWPALHQGLLPRDTVFAALPVYRRMYADVVVHVVNRV